MHQHASIFMIALWFLGIITKRCFVNLILSLPQYVIRTYAPNGSFCNMWAVFVAHDYHFGVRIILASDNLEMQSCYKVHVSAFARHCPSTLARIFSPIWAKYGRYRKTLCVFFFVSFLRNVIISHCCFGEEDPELFSKCVLHVQLAYFLQFDQSNS